MVELAPIPEVPELTVKQQEQTLLIEVANDAHIGSWKDLRWFAVGGDKPRSIVIVKRGSKPVQTVLTISKTHNPEAWESWQPVLMELRAEKTRTNGKRVSHEKLSIGRL
jgi:hypothetical protein